MPHKTEIVEAGVGVEREGDMATCGDPNTGSETVFANEHGITRVGYLDNIGPDSAGGRILGPGTQNVFVENWRISLPGDAIVGHGPGAHGAPVTANESADVFVDSGFMDPYGIGTVEAPDLEVVDLYVTYNGKKYSALQGGATFYTSGLGNYPVLSVGQYNTAYNHCHHPGNPSPPSPPDAPPLSSYLHGITYTIKNTGTHDAPPFKIGAWKIPNTIHGISYNGSAMTLVLYDGITEMNYWKDLNIEMIDESQVGVLKPGETFTDTFIPYSFVDPLQLSNGHYWFAVFADTYGTVLEPHENNSFKVIKLTLNDGCGF